MSAFRRTSFGLKAVVRPAMHAAFASRIVARLRARYGVLHSPPFTFPLPRTFGFCRAVAGAIALVLEAACRHGAHILGITCGEGVAVWHPVREYAPSGRTPFTHGAVDHRETDATLSRVSNSVPFSSHWHDGSATPGLACIGIANPTTMAADDTRAVQNRFQATRAARHGLAEAAERELVADTICTATQERQDALVALLDTRPDRLLVDGGCNSSSIAHMAEPGARHDNACRHVPCPDARLDRHRMRYRDPCAGTEIEICDGVAPRAASRIAFAAGASTPDSLLGEVMLRFAMLAAVHPGAARHESNVQLGTAVGARTSRSAAAAHSTA